MYLVKSLPRDKGSGRYWPLAPPAESCRGFLLYKFWRTLAGIFLEDLFWALFPHKNEEQKSGDKIREKIRRLKNKNPRKIRSAKNPTLTDTQRICPFRPKESVGRKGEIHCVSTRPLVPREALYQIHGQSLNTHRGKHRSGPNLRCFARNRLWLRLRRRRGT